MQVSRERENQAKESTERFYPFSYFALSPFDSLHRYSKALKAIGIWSKDEIRHYKKPHSGFDLDANAASIPRHSPQVDPERTRIPKVDALLN